MSMDRCITTCHRLPKQCEHCPKQNKDLKIIPILIWIIAAVSVCSIVYRIVSHPDYAYEITL